MGPGNEAMESWAGPGNEVSYCLHTSDTTGTTAFTDTMPMADSAHFVMYCMKKYPYYDDKSWQDWLTLVSLKLTVSMSAYNQESVLCYDHALTNRHVNDGRD